MECCKILNFPNLTGRILNFRQVGELSVVSYCSELASGVLQDLEFSKSCRKILEFDKIWNFLNLACLWDISKPDIEQANLHHPTIKFTAEISDTETVFLDTVVYKGTRFKEKSILDVKTHFKKTETFQYTHFTSCHPPSVKKGFVKWEALRILRTNSSNYYV